MPPLLKSARHRGFGQSGFTLIEVMTVVIVIGVIVSFITLSVDQHSERVVQDEAERLRALMVIARENAVLHPLNFALEIKKQSYRFVLPAAKPGEWEEYKDGSAFRTRDFTKLKVKMSLILDGQAVSLADKSPGYILFLSTGEVQPTFTLQIKGEEDGAFYSLYGDGVSKVELVKGERKDG